MKTSTALLTLLLPFVFGITSCQKTEDTQSQNSDAAAEAEAARAAAKEEAKEREAREKERAERLAKYQKPTKTDAKSEESSKTAANGEENVSPEVLLARKRRARSSYAGKRIEALVTRAGVTYTNVAVRRADDFGIVIQSDDGQASIAFPDLPEDIQTELAYDAAEYTALVTARDAKVNAEEAAKASELATREAAKAEAELNQSEKLALKAQIDKFRSDFKVTEAQLRALASNIEKVEDSTGNSIRRNNGRISERIDPNKAKDVAKQLAGLRAQRARLQTEADSLFIVMSLGPEEFKRVEPMWEGYKEKRRLANEAAARVKMKNDEINSLTMINDLAKVKSRSAEEGIDAAKAEISKLEVIAAKLESDCKEYAEVFRRIARGLD